MDYIDALEQIEQWLIKTGVRKYCRTKCKGLCCKQYCKEKGCLRPPLSCAVYLCDDVKKHMMDVHLAEKYQNNYFEILKLFTGKKIKTHTPEEIFTKINIPKKLITFITELDLKFDKNKIVSDHPWRQI